MSTRSDRRLAARRARLLRPAGFDELGLKRAISDRMLPFLVASMAFLALLALAGAAGAAALARHWQGGAGAAMTVQVPHPAQPAAAQPAAAQPGEATARTRLDAALAVVRATPGIASARALSDDQLNDLLRPWLGAGAERLALPLPAVIEVHLTATDASSATLPDGLAERLRAVAPGTLVESHGVWLSRLATLARSLQACAALALAVVAAVAVSVVAVATRAGLTARRDAIEIVHGLGATDAYIAGRFARRATLLAGTGGVAGALLGLPMLLGLARLAAPFATPAEGAGGGLPDLLWAALLGLPLAAAAIGWTTAQITVRRWLRRLP